MTEDVKKQFTVETNIRLSTMMFLQYVLFAVWWVPLAALLANTGVSGWQKTGILSTMAIGFFLAPVVGMIADRYVASQKVLFVFNLLGGILLFVAAKMASAEQPDPTLLFAVLVIQQLCYMPTWSLANSIAMANGPQEKFPQIRAFGSIGWVASGVFSWFYLKFNGVKIDVTTIPMYIGAVISVVAAFYALTLPHTPPPAKGQKASVVDALGLRTFTMMKDFNFAVFAIISLLAMIPFALYFNFGSQFLNDEGFDLITVTMNWGQLVEIVFMLGIPLVIARIGLKWAMGVGLLAMLVRYIAFYFGSVEDQVGLYFVAILVHGLIFGFFCVGGQMYTERKAPEGMKASAQGFIFLVTFGIGMLLGNVVSNHLIEGYRFRSYELPKEFVMASSATFDKNMLAIEGAEVSDVKIYGRILNDAEIEILAAEKGDLKKLLDTAKEKKVSVDIQKGVIYSGDELAGLAGKQVPKELTFSFKLSLPVPEEEENEKEKLSGSIIAAGTLKLSAEEGHVVYQAGEENKIEAYRVQLPRKEKDHEIYLAGTYDGKTKTLRLYQNGGLYVLYDWVPVWKITSIITLVLFVLFLVFFNDKIAKREEKQEPAMVSEDVTGDMPPQE